MSDTQSLEERTNTAMFKAVEHYLLLGPQTWTHVPGHERPTYEADLGRNQRLLVERLSGRSAKVSRQQLTGGDYRNLSVDTIPV